MRNEPWVAYRCGTLALGRVGRLLQPANAKVLNILATPSPETGFSLTALKDMADQANLM